MLLTLAQAAERLRMSAETLRLQARAGRLRAIKPGTDWLVEEREVERYRREIRRVSAPESGQAVSAANVAAVLGVPAEIVTADGPDYAAHRAAAEERAAFVQGVSNQGVSGPSFGVPRPAPKSRKRG